MHWSKYNYLFTSETHGHLLYNSFTNSFCKFNPDSYKEIIKIKNDTGNNSKDKSLMEMLVRLRVLVDDEADDLNNLRLQTLLHRSNTAYRTVTILPTLDCNFDCEYCFEDNRASVYMDDDTEKHLIEFIKSFGEFKKLQVVWYGGEPLLAFDRIVSITQKIKSLDADFSAVLITNGYLLDEKVIRQLKKLRINSIQVTVDGSEEVHNRRRPHVRQHDSYSRIIRNLDTLFNTESSENMLVKIRVNIDEQNQEDFIKAHRFLSAKYPKAIVYPGIVHIEETSTCRSKSNCTLDRNKVADLMIQHYEKYGIQLLNFFPKTFEFGLCTAASMYNYLIDPPGDLYKCWDDVGNSAMVIGNLKNLKTCNSTLLSRYLVGVDPFDDKKCRNCFYLPVCGGGCAHQRLLKKYHDGNIDTCVRIKNNLDKFLEIHYEIKMAQRTQSEKAANMKKIQEKSAVLTA